MVDIQLGLRYRKLLIDAIVALPATPSPTYTVQDIQGCYVTLTTPPGSPSQWTHGVMVVMSGDAIGLMCEVFKVNGNTIVLHEAVMIEIGFEVGVQVRLEAGPIKKAAVYFNDPDDVSPAINQGKDCFIVINSEGGDLVSEVLDQTDRPLMTRGMYAKYDIHAEVARALPEETVSRATDDVDDLQLAIKASVLGGQVMSVIVGFMARRGSQYIFTEEGINYNYDVYGRLGYEGPLEVCNISFDVQIVA